MKPKAKRTVVKKQGAAKRARSAKRGRRRVSTSVDAFVLTSFIEALVRKGYSRSAARLRAKELLSAPGFAGLPSPDAAE
jgi:hypothetical protein